MADSQNGAGVSGGSSQIQLHSRLHGVRSEVQNTSDIITRAIRVCGVAALDLEETEQGSQVSRVDTALRSLIDTQQQLEIEQALLTQLISRSAAEDGSTGVGEYQRSFDRKMKQYVEASEAERYGGSAAYVEFRRQLWELRHEGEPMAPLFTDTADEGDDVLVAGARATYKCPITATWLIEPVTSDTCGHSFSRAAITQYLQRHRTCPVDGCRTQLSMGGVHRNHVLERRVAQHLRRLEEQESAVTYTMVQ
ncbi:hypothetical protein GGI07_002389 [Coemansia sp. Benny D115]|nr:hypothetical protein GGI07_002389 [Coemansia sp. Benny D115]